MGTQGLIFDTKDFRADISQNKNDSGQQCCKSWGMILRPGRFGLKFSQAGPGRLDLKFSQAGPGRFGLKFSQAWGFTTLVDSIHFC